MKICTKCEKEKELEEFVKSPSCKDGRRGVCKECWKVKGQNYYKENKEEKWIGKRDQYRDQKKQWDKKYKEKNRVLLNAKQKLNYYNRNEEEHQKALERKRKYDKTDKAKIWNLEYKNRQKKRYLATSTLNNAVRDGKLIRPEVCSICQSKGSIEGHHADYDKPLEVVWVCKKCHTMIHKNLKKGD